MSTTLQENLREWTDVDGACYCLAIALGVAPDAGLWGGKKWVFWSANPLGEGLYRMLESLAKIGVLEKRETDDVQFRWNPQFSWESYGEDRAKA